MKNVTVLGSTGSVGVQALQVIENNKEDFNLIGISANKNINLLIEQAKQYNPRYVCICNQHYKEELSSALNSERYKILSGRDGLLELSQSNDADIMLNALVGSEGMEPTINAINSGINIALSNKESLVMAGEIIKKQLNKNNVNLYPVDSEHSAIWQCLLGEKEEQIERIILTGSGGPFRTRDISDFHNITKKEALKHPNWSMGNKITIDSATMMNKGFEVIEAFWLFNISLKKIDIVVHPQSLIHSMIEFIDGSIKAQISIPDMRLPILYALSYPERLKLNKMDYNFNLLRRMDFEPVDLSKFKCIKLAYNAIKLGGTYLTVLNVSNDIAVRLFLEEKISFIEIPELINKAMNKHISTQNPSLENILEATKWTEKYFESYNL